MKYTALMVALSSALWLPGCSKNTTNPKATPPIKLYAETPVPNTEVRTSPKPAIFTPSIGRAVAPVMQTLAPAEVDPKIKVTGRVTQALRWRDTLGQNTVVFSEERIAPPKPVVTGDQGPGRALYATHYLMLAVGGEFVRKREVKDRYESCGFDLDVRFLKSSFGVTDLDGDGVGEVTFAYVVDCVSDVSPKTLKLLMLEDGSKYILRGQSSIQLGPNETAGGVFRVDQSFTSAPTSFLLHAGKLWSRIRALK